MKPNLSAAAPAALQQSGTSQITGQIPAVCAKADTSAKDPVGLKQVTGPRYFA